MCGALVFDAKQKASIIARDYQSIEDRRAAIAEAMCVAPRKSVPGVIFCVGGRGKNGDPLRSAEAYDCCKNRWCAVTDMGVRRRHVGVVTVHQKL